MLEQASSELSVVRERVAQLLLHSLSVPATKAALLTTEYLKFMTLKSEYSKAELSPSPRIDQVWHAHLLDTRSYRTLEAALGAGPLDHDPLRSLDCRKDWQLRFLRTLNLLVHKFKTPMASLLNSTANNPLTTVWAGDSAADTFRSVDIDRAPVPQLEVSLQKHYGADLSLSTIKLDEQGHITDLLQALMDSEGLCPIADLELQCGGVELKMDSDLRFGRSTVLDTALASGMVLHLYKRSGVPRPVVNVTVRTLTRKIVVLPPMHATDSVLFAKAQLQKLEGLPPDQQRLIYKSRQMWDLHSLAHYSVVNGACLHMVLRLGGC
ncbi:hypothetical protein WJX72_010488 [[Myrmecia] bisecta]|uniref:Ubiquitin-like domain-containing protein n=1 Tax=[Myrmecia] bisecta TaxID=41462 RepID=A0AAW1R8A4_9CHLO